MDDSSSRDGLRPDCRQSRPTPQPLAGPISASLALSARATGRRHADTGRLRRRLAVHRPATDLLENRRLVLVMLAVCVLALLGAGLSPSASVFLTAALFVGFASVVVQCSFPTLRIWHRTPSGVGSSATS